MTARCKIRRRAGFRARVLAMASGVGVVASAAACSGAVGDADDAPFYEGETIEIIVPFDTGGGTDTIGRFLAELLSEHIEGNPDVQVINMPGADTMIGHNEFAQREPDGMSLLLGGATGTFYYMFDNPDAHYDYADWEPLAGVPQGSVVYVSPETGVADAVELTTTGAELVLGARSPDGADLARIFTLDFLGVEYTPVFGYDGSGPSRIAFEQGESNLNSDTTTAYIEQVVPMIEAGTATPMYAQGQVINGELVRDPAVPDLPSVAEVYEEAYGEAPTGPMVDANRLLTSAGSTFNKILFVQSAVPQEAQAALNTALDEILDDPDYADGVDAFLGGYEMTIGEDLDASIAEILDPDPATVDFIKEYANENYDANMA